MHCPTEAWGIHRILNTAYRHILGHGDTYPARSHPTHSRHTFNRPLTRRPVSRNWWGGRENHHQWCVPHHCKYPVSLDRGAYKQLSYSDHFSIGFVLSTPYISGTRHSDRRPCAPRLEAQSTRKRGCTVDRRNSRLSEAISSCTC